MLPGTNRAADRYVRASLYVKAIPQTGKARNALASMLGVIRNASVPLGISAGQPKHLVDAVAAMVAKGPDVLLRRGDQPQRFWVLLADLDLKPGAPVKKLPLAGGETYSGNAAEDFVAAAPFAFFAAPAGSATGCGPRLRSSRHHGFRHHWAFSGTRARRRHMSDSGWHAQRHVQQHLCVVRRAVRRATTQWTRPHAVV